MKYVFMAMGLCLGITFWLIKNVADGARRKKTALSYVAVFLAIVTAVAVALLLRGEIVPAGRSRIRISLGIGVRTHSRRGRRHGICYFLRIKG